MNTNETLKWMGIWRPKQLLVKWVAIIICTHNNRSLSLYIYICIALYIHQLVYIKLYISIIKTRVIAWGCCVELFVFKIWPNNAHAKNGVVSRCFGWLLIWLIVDLVDCWFDWSLLWLSVDLIDRCFDWVLIWLIVALIECWFDWSLLWLIVDLIDQCFDWLLIWLINALIDCWFGWSLLFLFRQVPGQV